MVSDETTEFLDGQIDRYRRNDVILFLIAVVLGLEPAAQPTTLLLTDQPAVFADWPEPACEPLRAPSVSELRGRPFEAGSMAPKVEAACRFVEQTGRVAAIGSLPDARSLLEGTAGTTVRP